MIFESIRGVSYILVVELVLHITVILHLTAHLCIDLRYCLHSLAGHLALCDYAHLKDRAVSYLFLYALLLCMPGP